MRKEEKKARPNVHYTIQRSKNYFYITKVCRAASNERIHWMNERVKWMLFNSIVIKNNNIAKISLLSTTCCNDCEALNGNKMINKFLYIWHRGLWEKDLKARKIKDNKKKLWCVEKSFLYKMLGLNRNYIELLIKFNMIKFRT